MEFWLIQDKEKIQLPIPPSDYEISNELAVDTFDVELAGEISFIGRKKLSTTSISSFFPSQRYSFCQVKPLKPYEYIALIKKWRESGKPIRLVITQTDVDLTCTIDKFSYGEKDGSKDIYFSLDLREYRIVKE
jgi:hypothetical protein